MNPRFASHQTRFPSSLGSVLPAEDVTCGADCGSASLAATSAGGAWDYSEPTPGNRPSRPLLSAGFTSLFSFFFSFSRSADPTLLDTRGFLAVATLGLVGFFFCNEEEKKKDLRLISLGQKWNGGWFYSLSSEKEEATYVTLLCVSSGRQLVISSRWPLTPHSGELKNTEELE